MKKKLFAVFSFLVLASGTTFALDVDSCWNLNVSGTTYVLNQSVSSTGTCMNVTADNVTLDCRGHTINYSQNKTGYGVNSSQGYDYLVVEDCVFVQDSRSEHAYGIYVYGAKNASIKNNTFLTWGFASVGIILESTTDSSISHNHIKTSGDLGHGIYAYYCGGENNMFNNSVETSGKLSYGISAYNSDWNVIKENDIVTYGESSTGVRFYNCSAMNVSKNQILVNVSNSPGVQPSGIQLFADSDNNLIVNNTIETREWEGIRLVSSGSDTPDDNQIFNNLINGVIDFVKEEPRSLLVPVVGGLMFVFWRRRTKVVVDTKVLLACVKDERVYQELLHQYHKIYTAAESEKGFLGLDQTIFIDLSDEESVEAEELSDRYGVFLDAAKALVLSKRIRAKKYMTGYELPEELFEKGFGGARILRIGE